MRELLSIVCMNSFLYPQPITPSDKIDHTPQTQKACRTKDKPFYFWVFDDSLLYCSPLPASYKHRYQFHRRLPLAECQIRVRVVLGNKIYTDTNVMDPLLHASITTFQPQATYLHTNTTGIPHRRARPRASEPQQVIRPPRLLTPRGAGVDGGAAHSDLPGR